MLQVQHTSIRPLTTAHLAQTMSLLTLSNQELRDKVLSELAANPALELVEERVCPTCHRRLTSPHCPKCSQQPAEGGPIVFLSPRQASPSNGKRLIEEEPIETEPAAPEDLGLHVLQQLAADLRLEDRAVAAYILASLDEDGFLQEPPPLVARATSRHAHAGRPRAEADCRRRPLRAGNSGPQAGAAGAARCASWRRRAFRPGTPDSRLLLHGAWPQGV